MDEEGSDDEGEDPDAIPEGLLRSERERMERALEEEREAAAEAAMSTRMFVPMFM